MDVVMALLGLVPVILVAYLLLGALRLREAGDHDMSGPLTGYGMLLGIFVYLELSILIDVLHLA